MRRGGVRERGRKVLLLSPSYSLPRLFSSVPHFAPLSTIQYQERMRSFSLATIHHPLSTVHYAWNRLVHSWPESFFQCRCKGSIDFHLGVLTFLKTIPALALVKRPFFSIFRFAVKEIFGDLFLMPSSVLPGIKRILSLITTENPDKKNNKSKITDEIRGSS